MNYRLRDNVELVTRDNGIFLMSRSPLCVLRLNQSLADILELGRNGAAIQVTETVRPVMEHLASKGFVELLRSAPLQSGILPDISIVIPVKDRAGELQRCLDSILSLNYPQEKLQIIVVDDGSSDDSAQVARRCGAVVVPSGGCGRGPAAARNVGAALASGEILAFIDSDCTATVEWLNELVPTFGNPQMAAVGGQVDGMCNESIVDRYESTMSSLSLGSRERTGSSGTDTFYLPSCNMLVRRSAFRTAGGFKDEMHVGEDVDLTWRLRDNGWTISYIPAGNVLHEHRSSIKSFMSRRFDYGTSEGMLQILHPIRRKRMVIPPLLAALLTLCLAAPFISLWLFPLALCLLLIDLLHVRRRVRRQNLPISALDIVKGRLRALGSLVYYLSYHVVRYYSLPLIIGALLAPVVGLVYLAVLLCSAGVDYAIKKPQLSFLAFTLVYLLEQVSYGYGVFWGCLTHRCFASYRVSILTQADAAT
jgi:mycofactocin system glycosyltransferase